MRPAFLLQREDGLRLFLWADNLALVSAVSFRWRYWRAIQIVIILGMERHEAQRRGATGLDLVQHARNRCKILISGGRGRCCLSHSLMQTRLGAVCHADIPSEHIRGMRLQRWMLLDSLSQVHVKQSMMHLCRQHDCSQKGCRLCLQRRSTCIGVPYTQ